MRRTDGLSIDSTSRRPQHVEKSANGLVAHDIELPLGYRRVPLLFPTGSERRPRAPSISRLPASPSLHLDTEHAQDLRV